MNFFRIALLGLILSGFAVSQAGGDNFQLRTRIGFSEGLLQASYLRNENRLLLIGKNSIQLWDIASNKIVRTYPHEIIGMTPGDLVGRFLKISFPMSFSPDGSRGIVLLPGAVKKSWSAAVWDLQTGKRAGVLQRAANPIRTADFSEDGRSLISTHGDLSNAEIAFWDAETFSLKNSIFIGDLSWYHLTADGEKIFLASGKAQKWFGNVISYAPSGRIELRDTATGKIEKTFTAENIKIGAAGISEPAVSKDERFLAAKAENKIVVWDTSGTGAPKFEIPAQANKSKLRLIEITKDGKYVVAAQGKEAWAYELETGKLFREFPIPDEAQFGLSPDSKYAIFRSTGSATVYDLETRKILYTLGLGTYTSDDPYGGVSSSGELDRLRISPNGKFIMIYGDNEVDIFDISTGDKLQTLFDPQTAKYKESGKLKSDGLNGLTAGWIGDGDSVYVFGSEDRTYLLWKAK